MSLIINEISEMIVIELTKRMRRELVNSGELKHDPDICCGQDG
jgi:hypothetical protein